MVIGVLILVNAMVLGLETDLATGPGKDEGNYVTIRYFIEFFFCLVFVGKPRPSGKSEAALGHI